MPPTALDTTVIVAGLLTWHDSHEGASRALDEALGEPQKAILPLHALLEAYSVISRLPSPYRLSPEDTFAILHGSLKGTTRIVALDDSEAWPLLEQLAARTVHGGTCYDAMILECAKKGGATRLLTFNRRHFERLPTAGVEIQAP